MIRSLSCLVVASWLLACAKVHAAVPVSGTAARFDGLTGGMINLETFRGVPVLVVNTASQCGYTGQYAGLEALWRRMRDRGFVIVGVPSNDFGGQEPGDSAEIAEFCTANFGVTFPMTAKSVVRGGRRHPFFAWAEATLGPAGVPTWNFHKILVGPDGRVVAAFASSVEPDSTVIVDAVTRAAQKP
jgi:glutathione peroxidase